MNKFTDEEIKQAKAMKAKEFYTDLKSLFNRYEAYQDHILGVKTLEVMIRCIEGAIKSDDAPLKKNHIMALKRIDKNSLEEFNKIKVMMLIVKK